jgi:hypothetical protein
VLGFLAHLDTFLNPKFGTGGKEEERPFLHFDALFLEAKESLFIRFDLYLNSNSGGGL